MNELVDLDKARQRKQKLQLLNVVEYIWYDRFAIIKSDDGSQVLDLYTNKTYDGKIVNIDENGSGILILQLSEDGLDVLGKLRSIIFIAKDSTWMQSEIPLFDQFELAGEPIELNGRATIYRYYRDGWVNEQKVSSMSTIAMISCMVKDRAYMHKEYNFIDLKSGKLLGSVHSTAINKLRSLSRDELEVEFFDILEPDTGRTVEEEESRITFRANSEGLHRQHKK